jgi:hypothetical protein
MQLIRSDLDFIIAQILQAETNAPIADPSLPVGLRAVDGTHNSILAPMFGAADQVFPRLTNPVFRNAEAATSYEQSAGTVIDSQPRIISNLVADQNILTNPAAHAVDSNGDGTIPNTPSDGGAPFHQWFAPFGQLASISSPREGAAPCSFPCNPAIHFMSRAVTRTSWFSREPPIFPEPTGALEPPMTFTNRQI